MSERHPDFVHCVTVIVSWRPGGPMRHVATTPFTSYIYRLRRQIHLDTPSVEWRNYGDIYAEIPRSSGSQNQRLATRRRAPSSPRARPRPGVPPGSVLRPARPCPGEIRNGPAPPGRRPAGHRRRRSVQRQSPGLLRNSRGVRGRRAAGAAAEAPGAEACPQMHRGDPRFRGALVRAPRGSRRDGGDRAALPPHDSSTLARAGLGPAEKKTGGVGTRSIVAPRDTAYLQAQYEAVRRMAAARRPHAEPPPGCLLLMSRGLPAWLEVVQRVAPRRGNTTPIAVPGVHGPTDAATLAVRSDLTQLLAGLVLACAQEEVRV